MTRLPLILIGFVFLLAAGLGYLDYASQGFPDGHRTAFELETQDVRFAVVMTNLFAGIFAVALGVYRRRASIAVGLIVVAVFVLVTVPGALLPRCPEMRSCSSIYETITGHLPDHGIGG